MPAQSRDLRVVEVNEVGKLASWRDEWGELLCETPGATFFQTLEWLEVHWRHFGDDHRSRTLLILDNDRLFGVLPLAVQREKSRLGALRVLGYPLDGWGTTYGPIGRDPASVLAAGLRYLQAADRDWDALELRWTADEAANRFTAAFDELDLSVIQQPGQTTSLIELTGTWDDYWSSRTSKQRNCLRRGERRIAEVGDVSFMSYRATDASGDPRWDLYDQCEQVAAASWQGTSTTGNTITHNRVRSFLRDVHTVASHAGCTAINLLHFNGEPIAFGYNYVFNGVVFGLRVGFDSRFAKAGPGNLLICRTIEDSYGRGDRLFDLGEGESPYKRLWATATAKTVHLCHYPRHNWRGQARRWKHWWHGNAHPASDVAAQAI